MTHTCDECGCDPDASWWSQRPRPGRALRQRARRTMRPLHDWWYAPALRRSWHLVSPLTHGFTLQPWEYMDPNPMPTFSLWRIWPSTPPARPHPAPVSTRSFLPYFTAERGPITYRVGTDG